MSTDPLSVVVRLKPEMRSFHDVLVHIASGNVFAAKAGRGEKVKWDELNPKDYPTKAAVVAMFEKTAAEANDEVVAGGKVQQDGQSLD